jgi:hypothetical protein
MQSPDEFYEAHIKNGLDELAGKAYQKVCREFMELMNQYHHLPAQFERFGSLYGKSGFDCEYKRGKTSCGNLQMEQ